MKHLLIFLALALADPALARWGTGCAPVGVTAARADVRPDAPCSAQCTCGCNADGPCPCTGTPAKAKDAIPNFGLVEEKISDDVHYKINGKEVTPKEAFEAVADKQLPNDAGLLRLTVIGTPEEQKAFKSDWATHAAFAEYRAKCLLQTYPPEHWAVSAKAGFVSPGHPTVYLEAPDGKVLLRQDSYESPEKLAQTIRKADPNYDPTKDPNGNPVTPADEIPIPAWILGGMAALYVVKWATDKKP